MRNSDDERRITDYVFNTATKLIDSQGNRNELRNQYANLMATRDWVNRDMDNLVSGIMRALPELERELAGPRDNLTDWIDKAIDIMVDGNFAAMVVSTPDVVRELDRDLARDLQKSAQVWEDFASPRGRRDLGRGNDRREPARGGIGAVGNSYGANRGRGEVETTDSWSFLANAGNKNNQDDHDDRDDHDERPREETRRAPPAAALQPEPEPESYIEGPDYTKADPWADFWQAGEHWQAVHRTKWKLSPILDGVTVDELDLVPKYYNVNTHLKYYVKNERGEVREELIEVSDDNRYLSHQLLQNADQDYKPPIRSASVSLNPRAPVQDTFTDSDARTEAAYREETPALVDLLAELTDEQISGVQVGGVQDSIYAAVFGGRAKLAADKDKVRIDLSVLRTPVLVTDDEQSTLIARVNEAPTMTAAAQLMVQLKPQFDPALYDVLNSRLTKTLRHVTAFQFQYDGLSDQIDFAQHFPAIIDHVAKKRGKEWAAAYATRVSVVRNMACAHLSNEDLASGLAGLVTDTNIKAVVFADYHLVISLDATLDQLGLGKSIYANKSGVSVTSTGHPPLFSALSNTYRRIAKLYQSVIVRIHISTSDNRLIEVMPFSARSDAFILGLVN